MTEICDADARKGRSEVVVVMGDGDGETGEFPEEDGRVRQIEGCVREKRESRL